MKKFGRLLTAMVTPFNEKVQVDYAQAKKLAKALLVSGSDGLVVAGTTGESPTLTTGEKLRLFEEIRSAIGNKATIDAMISASMLVPEYWETVPGCLPRRLLMSIESRIRTGISTQASKDQPHTPRSLISEVR
jgi:hypothetical protein